MFCSRWLEHCKVSPGTAFSYAYVIATFAVLTGLSAMGAKFEWYEVEDARGLLNVFSLVPMYVVSFDIAGRCIPKNHFDAVLRTALGLLLGSFLIAAIHLSCIEITFHYPGIAAG